MTELIKIQNTMSSVQIAELTGKLHKHVMRDIRNLIDIYQNLTRPHLVPLIIHPT